MSTTIETIAQVAFAGVGIWLARAWLRKAAGFKEAAPHAEGFAKATQVVAPKEAAPVCVIRPGVTAFRDYVLARWGGADAGICGDKAHQQRASEHNVGRAWDWKVPSPEAANEAIDWLESGDWEMARRLGIGIVIHKGRIWSAWVDGAEPMQRAYTGANPHNTHVHFSFSHDGANGKTSGYAMLTRKGGDNV